VEEDRIVATSGVDTDAICVISEIFQIPIITYSPYHHHQAITETYKVIACYGPSNIWVPANCALHLRFTPAATFDGVGHYELLRPMLPGQLFPAPEQSGILQDLDSLIRLRNNQISALEKQEARLRDELVKVRAKREVADQLLLHFDYLKRALGPGVFHDIVRPECSSPPPCQDLKEAPGAPYKAPQTVDVFAEMDDFVPEDLAIELEDSEFFTSCKRDLAGLGEFDGLDDGTNMQVEVPASSATSKRISRPNPKYLQE